MLTYHVEINSDIVGPPIARSIMAGFQHANKWRRVIRANTSWVRVSVEKVHQNKGLAFGIHGWRLLTFGAFTLHHTFISICKGKTRLL
jgi:hypothetical protein